MMSASQAILRTVEAVTGPVNVNEPVPGSLPGSSGWGAGLLACGPVRRGGSCRGCPGPGCPVAVAGSLGGGVFEPVQEVAVVDGDHDLGPESARGGEAAGGQGCLAGADEAVEEPLRPGPQVQGGIRWPPVSSLSGCGPQCLAGAVIAPRRPRRCRRVPVVGGCGGWWRCS